jgi:hypothetical protein
VKRHLKWLTLAAVPLLAAAGYGVNTHRYWFPAGQSQFDRDTVNQRPYLAAHPAKGSAVELNSAGALHYLYDDFASYAGVNSKLIDSMDVPPPGLGTDEDAIEGKRATAGTLSNHDGQPIILHTTLPRPVDLARWAHDGYLTLWLKIADGAGISGVSITLGDAKGATRRTAVLPNLQTSYPNFPNANDPFVDLAYPEPTHAAEWTDFRLTPGWNLLPWRMDQATDEATVDLARITWYDITLATTPALNRQPMSVDDLRVSDGLQLARNAVGGAWAPPLGMPQYGVFDVDRISPTSSALRLLNVRQTQYPSNGDHGRLLSRQGAPLNFAMRARFSLNQRGSTNNTWLRLLYDFDPDYDPGHDWFGSYLSFDYHKFGLQTVIPVERFAVQAQEPADTTGKGSYRTDLSTSNGVVYEYQVTVRGQRATATVYEVHGGRLYQRASVSYTFTRARYADKRYPIGIEITGNVQATIYAVELMEL